MRARRARARSSSLCAARAQFARPCAHAHPKRGGRAARNLRHRQSAGRVLRALLSHIGAHMVALGGLEGPAFDPRELR